MNSHTRSLAQQIIAQHGLGSIEDIMASVPLTLCHVLQEPDVFKTYSPEIVRLKYPKDEWSLHITRYEHYRDNIIAALSVDDYLQAMLDPGSRLPCFCSQMADVAGTLLHVMTGERVYAVRNIFVNYLYLPQRWHCINAVVREQRIRYFDVSAYAQVLDKPNRKVVHPAELDGFNAADIATPFIYSERWLQKEPFVRHIELKGLVIEDNFHPSPVSGKPLDEFQRVFDFS
ncbi:MULTISPECIES: hypothetical protein [unclassified Pseudomonas]|jgi:hypothetical protein|uniref:hypothetical protein n=1 Tax=unclassified Pseudomonas TaxID=196821 RepID=UPI000D3CC229|nr:MULTISPECIES: hypothetical protein [unclassified Pseudomonas]PTR23745.1 hypothetical protein C8K63_107118 [Pseudomonas sp. GV085]